MELTMHLDEVEIETLAHELAPMIAAELENDRQSTSPWMDVAAVAKYTGMTEQAVRDAKKRGHLRACRTSTGRLRFHIDDVEAFIRGRTP